jgi:hypothetical protein
MPKIYEDTIVKFKTACYHGYTIHYFTIAINIFLSDIVII